MNAPFDANTPDHDVTSVAQLEALYGQPKGGAVTKEIDYISDHYKAFIEKAPFVVIATGGPEGLDTSPRGDPAGFVRVEGRHTVLIPDRRGNNRLDTLKNIVRDSRVALLFLIPGVRETIRVNGQARITTDPDLCESFTIKGKAPKSIICVTAERVYFQCQKALVRSRLWEPDARIDRKTLPTAGDIIQALSTDGFDGKAYDEAYPERMKEIIY